MAAIEIDNLLDILQQKENDITVNDDTKEIIKILSAIKISKQQILRSYALLSELPNPSLINKGNIYYVESENGLYVSTSAAWLKIESTSLSSFNVISGAPSGNGSLTYDNTTGEFIFNPADLSNKLELLDLSVCTNSANGVGNLSYNNHTGEFSFTPPDLSSYAVTGALSDFICLTDLSICTNTASGSGALAYDNTTGEFAFTPADIDSCFTNGSICNLYMTGTLCGPSIFTIDPAAHGDNTGTVVIAGNLQIDGTTTTVNSCTLEVADKNIVLSCGANNKAASDGAGITTDLGSDGTATILYDATDDDWNFNKKVSVTGDIEATGSIIANGTTLGLGNNQKEFVATGAISAGEIVSLRNDGTVENTVEEIITTPNSAGTPIAFNSTSSQYITTVFDSNSNQVIVAHSDSGVFGTGSKAGSVSGNSITFGSSTSFESAFVWYSVMSFDSNTNQVVIAFKDNNNSGIGTAVVGTISGSSITYGSHTTFNGGNILTTISNTFDSNSNKTVIGFRDFRGKGYARVGTVSGTSISFGTDAIFDNAAVTNIASTFDSNTNKVVMAYTNSSGYGAAAVGNISGTDITFGTPVVFSNASTSSISATFDTNTNKIVISYSNGGNSSYGTAIVGTVSGTSISFGTPVVFSSGSTSSISSAFDSNTNKVVIAYTDGSNNSYGTAIDGSVSGTTIGFGTPNVFNNVSTSAISASFDSNNNKTVIAYRDGTNNSYGTALVYQSEVTQLQTNADSWIGIAAENIANTATGKIDLPGALNRSQTGLTPNSIYYVASDGSLTTTATQYGKIGRAYSATELQIFESYKQLNFASQLIFGN